MPLPKPQVLQIPLHSLATSITTVGTLPRLLALFRPMAEWPLVRLSSTLSLDRTVKHLCTSMFIQQQILRVKFGRFLPTKKVRLTTLEMRHLPQYQATPITLKS